MRCCPADGDADSRSRRHSEQVWLISGVSEVKGWARQTNEEVFEEEIQKFRDRSMSDQRMVLTLMEASTP